MEREKILERLAELQQKLIQITRDFGEHSFRRMHNSCFSPIGWHLRHTLFVEDFWLHEKILSNNHHTEHCRQDFQPWKSEKSERGKRLPPFQELVSYVSARQKGNIELLREVARERRHHPLLRDDYLLKFLLQHHAMHIETMYAISNEQKLARAANDNNEEIPDLEAMPARKQATCFAQKNYYVGGEDSWCFDNELPRQKVALPAFAINSVPVCNSEFKGFMEANCYQEKRFWSEAGWRWLEKNRANAPHTWRKTEKGRWAAVGPCGWRALKPLSAISGINFFEARAFAKYAGARLPTENEWEIGCREGNFNEGGAWEWCSSVFLPRAGYKPFPYKQYSESWFDGKHHTLKGGSPYTAKELQRPSFRNFYTSEKKYVFSGLRLAFDV